MNVDKGHISDAEAWAEKAIEADRRHGVRWSLARDHTLLTPATIQLLAMVAQGTGKSQIGVGSYYLQLFSVSC